MKKIELENFASDIVGQPIEIRLQTKSGKWYEQEYTQNFTDIETNKTYGVCIDSTISYDFKTGKTEDSFLKSFVNQHITKYEMKRFTLKDGALVKPTKSEVIEKLKNSNRVSKFYFYTTLYGIGFFCFIMTQKTFNLAQKSMANYLESKNVKYETEFSEAGWVYRFVINQNVKIHNELLNDFEI